MTTTQTKPTTAELQTVSQFPHTAMERLGAYILDAAPAWGDYLTLSGPEVHEGTAREKDMYVHGLQQAAAILAESDPDFSGTGRDALNLACEAALDAIDRNRARAAAPTVVVRPSTHHHIGYWLPTSTRFDARLTDPSGRLVGDGTYYEPGQESVLIWRDDRGTYRAIGTFDADPRPRSTSTWSGWQIGDTADVHHDQTGKRIGGHTHTLVGMILADGSKHGDVPAASMPFAVFK